MEKPPVFRLTDAEKDALIVDQAALIKGLAARVSELESLVGKAKKTSSNSHQPPSSDGPGHKNRTGKDVGKRAPKPRPSRPGISRPLAEEPDRTERRMADACPHCTAPVFESEQRRRHGYDHIDLPVIRPVATRVELFGGRCRCCGKRYRADPPVGKPPGTPFGPGIRSLPAYLHHSHHVGFERLSRMLGDPCRQAAFQPEGQHANRLRRQSRQRLDALLGAPAAHPAGRDLQRQIKAWRTKFFVFMTDRRLPPTNNRSEQEIRPSVVFRKVTNGFRSQWGPKIHAGYRSVTGTARLHKTSAWNAVRSLIDGNFAIP